MNVWVERTPNPNSIKLVPDIDLPFTEPVRVRRGEPSLPDLGAALTAIEGVAECLLSRTFVAVTRQSANIAWDEIELDAIDALLAFDVSSNRSARSLPTTVEPSDDPVEAQARQILDKQVNPVIARDGGHARFVALRNQELEIELVGACGGCPSATVTLKRVIEAQIMKYVPEIRRVVVRRQEDKPTGEPIWKRILKAHGARFRA